MNRLQRGLHGSRRQHRHLLLLEMEIVMLMMIMLLLQVVGSDDRDPCQGLLDGTTGPSNHMHLAIWIVFKHDYGDAGQSQHRDFKNSA